LGALVWSWVSLLKLRTEQRPKSLNIGVWAGASPSKKVDILRGLSRLEQLGFTPLMPKNFLRNATRIESSARFYLAGSDQDKVAALVELAKNPNVANVLCVRGGYGTIRLLRHLDQKLKARAAPLRLWGFSDLTTIQHYLYFRFGWAWVHSPMLFSDAFCKPSSKERQAWLQLTANAGGFKQSLSIKHLYGPRPMFKSTLRAPLLGGNLASLGSLYGTKWDPSKHLQSKFLLFIEDINEAPRQLDRQLVELAEQPFMKHCKAVLLGHFTDCPKSAGILKAWANDYKIAVLGSLNAGHDRPNIPMPMGQRVQLSVKKTASYGLELPILKFG
jgi:muramoyltetrapeptide carboxypeptidase